MNYYTFSLIIFYLFVGYQKGITQKISLQKADSLTHIRAYKAANEIYLQLSQNALHQNQLKKFCGNTIKYAVNLQRLGKYDEAIPPLQNVILKTNSINGLDSLRALAFHKTAVSQYYLYNYNQAIQNYKIALNIRQTFLPYNHKDIIKVNRNIGANFLFLGDVQSAIPFLQNSIQLHSTIPDKDSLLLAFTFSDIGTAYSDLNDFNQAEFYLLTALKYYQRIYRDAPWELGNIYDNLALFYINQKASKTLIQTMERAISIFQKIPKKEKQDYWQLSNFYNNIGVGYEQLDSLDKAIEYYNLAIEINKQFYEERKHILDDNYNNLSNIYRIQRNYPQAIDYNNRAIKINQELKNKMALAANFSSKSAVFFHHQNYTKALHFQQQAIQYLVPNFQPKNDYENPSVNYITNRPTLIEYLNYKALILQKLALKNDIQKNLFDAKNTYDLIIQLLDQVRFSFESDESKQFLAKNAKEIIEDAIEVYSELYKIDKDPTYLNTIFQLIERSKSGILLDALAETDAQTKAGVPIHFVNRERHLKKEISNLEANIKEESSTESLANREQIILLNRKLEKLIDTLKTNYPKYHQLKYAVAEVTLNDIELDSNQAILNYFIGKKNSYLLFISTEKTTFIQLGKDFPLEKRVKQLQNNLLGYHLSNNRSEQLFQQNADTLSRVSYDLYQQLIAPIEVLTKLPEELIIMPDGVLGYLPFELLLKAQPTNILAFGSYPYLLKEHPIHYNYSVALWQQMLEQLPTKTSNNFIAFAPSFKAIERPKEIVALRRGLGALTYNIPEVKAIQKIIGGHIYTNEEATKNNFLEQANAHRIIHLATHGKADEASSDNAYLAFFKKDSSSNALLTNRELYNTVLPVDMVVLSACETGIGVLQNGEGIMSLARGFSYAGAKSIIPSLWSVNDQTTTELMASFYTYLKAGKTKDAALRQAKLDFLNTHPHEDAHPFYWAAFIAIGDMKELDLSTNYQWWTIGLGIGSLFLLLFLLRKKEA